MENQTLTYSNRKIYYNPRKLFYLQGSTKAKNVGETKNTRFQNP